MQTRAASRRAAKAVLQPQFQLREPFGSNPLPEKPIRGQGTKRPVHTPAPRQDVPSKRTRKTKLQELQQYQDSRALPHGLGSIENPEENHTGAHQTVNTKNAGTDDKGDKQEQAQVSKFDERIKAGSSMVRRTNENPYRLMPGRTPFPQHKGPTAAQCQEVHDILEQHHEVTRRPSKIPPPSADKAGCGEVPDVLDGLIRTLISGHTTMTNADKAIREVILKYGQLDKDSIGGGSVNWDKVRLSSQEDLMKAIRSAGLALTKSTKIKDILDSVYEENQIRRAALVKEKETGESADVLGAAELTQGQKDHQILKIDSGVLTLDHIRGMTADDAMLEFTKYPGIGVKTASCLLLFCLHWDSFAVDTHVWRMCKWLGWVPQKASRDATYMHCEVRIPNHLKYGLHQLFIKHGKVCGRCRGHTVEGTSEWANVTCPLEHLLDRFDKRKTKVPRKQMKKTPTGNAQSVISRESVELLKFEKELLAQQSAKRMTGKKKTALMRARTSLFRGREQH